MTAEKEPQTKAKGREVKTIPPSTKAEMERLRKFLAENPNLIHPTGGKDARVFHPPHRIRGKPLSQTIVEERRCGLPPDETEIEERR